MEYFDTNANISGCFDTKQSSRGILTLKIMKTNRQNNLTHMLKFRNTFHSSWKILTLVTKFMTSFFFL